ncbi:TPA: alpha/beta fold hydrolase [Pseudomonas aeruginosa]|uniref:alpha/beta fold hydrolase n=1 Tax=Pseudomonas aeruginosa TaxID=287 RepID=UPI003AC63E01
MSRYAFVSTDVLDIAYLEWNPQGTRSAVLLHGWPDSPHGWRDLAESLADAGYRVLAPVLRGFAPTRFRDASTPRSGQLAALACDLLAFVDGLALQRPLLVGHDWGARAVASACGLREGVASHLVMLSVGYASNDPQQVLSLPQARSFWYQWFLATPRGERALREEGEAFARQMWDTWSPPGWYAERDFQEAAQAFSGPDWVAVVLHYYRHRWGFVAGSSAMGRRNSACSRRRAWRYRPWCCTAAWTPAPTPTVPADASTTSAGATSGWCWRASAIFRSARRPPRWRTRSCGSARMTRSWTPQRRITPMALSALRTGVPRAVAADVGS